MIQFKNIQLVHEVGQRENNEDFVGYLDQAVYVLCDGVGGNEKGEIASNIVVQTWLDLALRNAPVTLEEGLIQAERALSDHTRQHPESAGMATTLVVARPQAAGIEVGWVGDSRLYHFRQGNILFQTKDHSWVNEALDAGILTAEEAIGHPRKNIITRAVRGMGTHVELSRAQLTDIQAGDLFMLCSDGVLEAWSDEDLCALAYSSADALAFTSKLSAECARYSRDNFTALVWEVSDTAHEAANKEVTATSTIHQAQEATGETTIPGAHSDAKKPAVAMFNPDSAEGKWGANPSTAGWQKWTIPALFILCIVAIATLLGGYYGERPKETKQDTPIQSADNEQNTSKKLPTSAHRDTNLNGAKR